MIGITVDNTHIIVVAPFALKDVLKAIPGAQWDTTRKAWTYPRTTLNAAVVNMRLPQASIPRSPDFTALVDEARDEDERAEAARVAVDLPAPEITNTQMPPWAHQRQAYHFARGKQAAMLAMDMGTGKTRVAIDLIQNDDDRRVLIICPRSVMENWPREIAKYAAHPEQWRVAVLSGDTRSRTETLRGNLAYCEIHGLRLAVIVNYEGAWREPLAKALLKTGWDRVILDESHRIKSPTGVASKFMERLAPFARRRLALTGTPFAHSPLDIFGQYRFLDKSIYGGSFYSFKHRYAVWGGFNNHELLAYTNEQELRERFFGLAFSVRARDVLDLPEAVHVQRYVTLSPRARKMYDSMNDDFVAWVREGVQVTATNALVKLLRLQQITSGYMPVDGDEPNPEPVDDGKADALRDVLDDLDPAEPVVVFCRFRNDLDAVHRTAAAAGLLSAELSGRHNDLAWWQGYDERSAVNEHGKPERMRQPTVLAVQIQSGGVGIDLTRARYCVYYSLGFSLSDYAQSLARVHRPGQTRSVTYIHLLAADTIDVGVHDALAARQDVVDAIMRRVASHD